MRAEPNIVQIEKESLCLGLMIHTTQKTVYKDLPKVYRTYMDYYNSGKIPHIAQPWEYVSLSKNFDNATAWDYYTGYVVTDYEEQTEGLIPFRVPAGEYAIFKILCRNKLALSFKMGKMKKYIYTKWLPTSGYAFSGIDYEYSNEEICKENLYNIDLYVGIKKII